MMTLLGNYCRNKDVKTSIRVGVDGMPNVGKSSLINSLKRSRACQTGATPGVTKTMQEVQLDSKIKLLDSPGLVLASGSMSDASVALRNAIKVETLEDPVTPVVAIIGRVPRQHLMLHYGVATFSDTAEFLAKLAISSGKLKKGGVPDRNLAARIVLNDWNSGKIKYFTHPPETKDESCEISAEIVTEFAKEVKLDDLDKMDAEDMESLPTVLPSQAMLLPSTGVVGQAAHKAEEEMEESEDEEEEEEENEGQLSNKISITSGVKKADKDDRLPRFQAEGLAKMKKANKLREKKERKERK